METTSYSRKGREAKGPRWHVYGAGHVLTLNECAPVAGGGGEAVSPLSLWPGPKLLLYYKYFCSTLSVVVVFNKPPKAVSFQCRS